MGLFSKALAIEHVDIHPVRPMGLLRRALHAKAEASTDSAVDLPQPKKKAPNLSWTPRAA